MNYMNQGGPLIWLVLVLGILGLVAAVRYVLQQNRRDQSLAVGASIASATVAALATVTGFQLSVGGLEQVAADDRWIYLWGLKESLNNVVLALVFGVLVALLLTVGSYRRTSPGEAR